MPPLVIPQTYQVVCRGISMPGEVWANVFHVKGTVPLTSVIAGDIAARFRTFYDSIKTRLATVWSLNEIIVRDIGTQFGASYSSLSSPVTGTANAVVLPAQTALVITWVTAFYSRRGRGRTYLCGFTSLALGTVSTVDSATKTTIQTAADALASGLSLDGRDLGVASRLDLVTRPVTSIRISNTWDTQRRRRNKLPG